MPRTAVLIPCWNEEKTIAKVISDFRSELKDATIYVYDNNSTDKYKDVDLSNFLINAYGE